MIQIVVSQLSRSETITYLKEGERHEVVLNITRRKYKYFYHTKIKNNIYLFILGQIKINNQIDHKFMIYFFWFVVK